MSNMVEWEARVRAARKELVEAKTADQIRGTWKAFNDLGHRTLGRLLSFSDEAVERLIQRRDEREQGA